MAENKGQDIWNSLSAKGGYVSNTEKYTFSSTLAQQEAELKNNPLIARFAESRKKLASDPYRPAYHFVNPEGSMNDPNGLTFWQGRWHLFYQAYPIDEIPDPKDAGKPRMMWGHAHWGHAVSDDLVHWRDLPYAIYPDAEQQCWSGSTVVERDRVATFYPGIGAGQMVAISRDPLLLNWEKSGPANTEVGDADIWKEGDRYFSLIPTWNKYDPESTVPVEKMRNGFENIYGNAMWTNWKLWTSTDLLSWELHGDFVDGGTPFTDRFDEGCCPGFHPIGDKHILCFFSHTNGGQYLLGEYDDKAHRFKPYDHGRFNHGRAMPGGVHAPSVTSDGNGGVINILNINDGKYSADWGHIMSLPQRLTLGADKRIRIAPVESVAALRGDLQHIERMVLPANREVVLDNIRGNTMELDVEIDPLQAKSVQLNVLRSPDAEEQTSIIFYSYDQSQWFYDSPDEVVLENVRSSILPDVWPRSPERVKLKREGELLKLRVFIDRSVVEVFVNEKRYMAVRVYPGRKDSLGVSLRAQGGDAVLSSFDAWQMKSIWPENGR